MTTHYKHPRTPHLPWSPGLTEDDVRKTSLSSFLNCEIVVTEKMDGENTTLYCDHSHARSLDSRHHASRDWLKSWHSSFARTIPVGWRICGENLYARHSIAYNALVSYFYGFSVWNEDNICLSWSETLEWFEMLGVEPVKEIYRGQWDEKLLRDLKIDTDNSEGYVVRMAGQFSYSQFNQCVAKWVRTGHVQTEKHWMHAEIVPNQLLDS